MKLSVVMSVYNGASELAATLDSILAQSEGDFELIVVDDGSTDDTPRILAAYAARDPRIRVLTQENAGLTKALIRGCAEARAEVIARHDNGDRSLPDRFRRQLASLAEGHVLTACATRYTDLEGETLYVARADGAVLREGLRREGAAGIRALPHHGAAMFRAGAYRAAGGYRPEFRFAQDLDLWIRLAGLGTIGIVDEILYEATITPGSISGSHRSEQVRLTALAVALRDARDPAPLLRQAAGVVPKRESRRRDAAGAYFIASCLREQGNPKWRARMRDVLRTDPLHWRAWLSLLLRR
jgi:glycosyltransferase involved in cell wall biosynthesis